MARYPRRSGRWARRWEAGMRSASLVGEELGVVVGQAGDLFEDAPAWRVSQHFPRFRYYRDRKGRQFPELDMADINLLHSELQELQRSAVSTMIEIWRKCGVQF